MKALRAVLLVGCAFAPMARAATTPAPTQGDPRVRVVAYKALELVDIPLTALMPVRIVLGDHETIQMATGLGITLSKGSKTAMDGKPEQDDPKTAPADVDWYVVTSKGALIVQVTHPMPNNPTFLFVQTATEDGTRRLYRFRLSTRDGVMTGKDPDAFIEVDFTYPHVATPDEIAAARARRTEWRAERDAQRLREQQARLNAQEAAIPLNTAYDEKGIHCPEIAPRFTSDNGHQTKLQFAPHAIVPKVYSVDAQGRNPGVIIPTTEQTPDGLALILPTTYPRMRLVSNHLICDLRNNRFGQVGGNDPIQPRMGP